MAVTPSASSSKRDRAVLSRTALMPLIYGPAAPPPILQPDPRPDENRDLQHQQYQQAPRQSARLSARGETRRALPAGVEVGGSRIPRSRDREGGLRRGGAWREIVERRRHSASLWRAGYHA